MNKIYLRSLFNVAILLLISCQDKTSTASQMTKQSTISTIETTSAAIDSNTSKLETLELLEEKRGNHNRTIWQQPRMIIQKLGDLSTKTVVDIGAGPYGYFSFQLVNEAKKVIAVDINQDVLDFMNSMRTEILPPERQNALELRLARPEDPNIKEGEADIIILMNIYAYLPNHLNYLKNLRKGMSDKAQLLIVDFKMRKLPIGPPQKEKIPLYQVEQELESTGFRLDLVDDQTLDYQYMVIATKE